ncbi:MAG: hypothetical protein RI544_03625 [Haloquadratum sp.]|jgi:hypothetical protein|nr:hypothetical protein [Haloferacaceae archaeon]MDR9445230.1 hypothetical protein [Haloquadratum sp.]
MEVIDRRWRTDHSPPPHATGTRLVDGTDVPVAERVAEHAAAFPTDATVATAIIGAYLQTGSVERTIQLTAVGETRTRQVLHRCGVEGACGLTAAGREWIEAVLAGVVGLTEAQQQATVGGRAFVLGLYCLTHPPIEEVAAVVRRERYRVS